MILNRRSSLQALGDVKAEEIAPAKLTKTIVAFANAEGGELYVGIKDGKGSSHTWDGFARRLRRWGCAIDDDLQGFRLVMPDSGA